MRFKLEMNKLTLEMSMWAFGLQLHIHKNTHTRVHSCSYQLQQL